MSQLFQYMAADAKVEDSIAFTVRLLCGQPKALQTAHNGSVAVVPVQFDLTAHHTIQEINSWNLNE